MKPDASNGAPGSGGRLSCHRPAYRGVAFVSARRTQRGSALLVAMVMVFMLSILGVSAMRGSTLEKRMAVNAVQSAVVFQAAESATEIALNDEANLTTALAQDVTPFAWIDVTVPPVRDDIGLVSEVQIRHTGEGLAPGFSAGNDGSGFSALRFEIRSVIDSPDIGSRAGVEQGAYQVAPAR